MKNNIMKKGLKKYQSYGTVPVDKTYLKIV